MTNILEHCFSVYEIPKGAPKPMATKFVDHLIFVKPNSTRRFHYNVVHANQ